MKRDIRETILYREAEAIHSTFRRPGTGQISDAGEVHASPDGKYAVFAGSVMDRLEGGPPTRVCMTDLRTGETRLVTFGPNTDRLPKFSPDGRLVAFLSDRHKEGDFQLYLLDMSSGAARATPRVEVGWVEYLHWSPDGKRVLLGVAGHGADIAGGQGAITSKRVAEALPSWTPAVDTGDGSYRWRSAWIYELETDRVRQVSHALENLWEVVWCGDNALAAVMSAGPAEGLWYTATLQIVDIALGSRREIYKPKDQLGAPAASPSGEHLAIIEAVCSDRWVVAGELLIIERNSGNARRIDTRGVDISCIEWRSERQLLVAGHRGFETVVGLCDSADGRFTEVWCSKDITAGGFYAAASGLTHGGDCVLVGRGFLRPPEIAVIRRGEYQSVKSFDLGYGEQVQCIDTVERVTWEAPDDLEIQGWLLLPKDKGPHPLIMNVHGGPVWHSRPVGVSCPLLMLLRKRYAVFFPNPRGSSGRGKEFVRRVYGDMGGGDARDLLSGLDALVDRGVADPKRLGVTGGSYGGFMTSWLITQDTRFAAAVPVAPHNNQVSQHLLSNLPHFMALLLEDRYDNPGGRYFERSPIMHAHKVRTPTLNICGALDRCTPPEEAVQFHNALLQNGVKSALVSYPEEGHGVRRLPAAIDYAARVVSWFQEHMPTTEATIQS